MAAKTEVYTWRLSPAMKASLEEAARSTNRSVANLLDEVVAERLEAVGLTLEAERNHQRRLHRRAARFAGRFSGTDRTRAERAQTLVRARLAARHARGR